MLTVAKKSINFLDKLFLILQKIACSTGTTANFCGDESDPLYVLFKERGLTTAYKARFMLQVYVEKVDST